MYKVVMFLLIALLAAPVSSALVQRGGKDRILCPEGAPHSNTIASIASDAVLLALVTHIDRRMNRVRLGTELGELEVAASPRVLQELDVGEIILVSFGEDNIEFFSIAI